MSNLTPSLVRDMLKQYDLTLQTLSLSYSGNHIWEQHQLLDLSSFTALQTLYVPLNYLIPIGSDLHCTCAGEALQKLPSALKYMDLFIEAFSILAELHEEYQSEADDLADVVISKFIERNFTKILIAFEEGISRTLPNLTFLRFVLYGRGMLREEYFQVSGVVQEWATRFHKLGVRLAFQEA